MSRFPKTDESSRSYTEFVDNLTLPAHIILTVFGPTTLYGGITQYPASSISHGCRYSCWNFMKLQHYFQILLTSRSKSSRTKSIHGLRRNQPIKKTCIHIFHALQGAPQAAYCVKLCEGCYSRARYLMVNLHFGFFRVPKRSYSHTKVIQSHTF